MNSNKQAFLPHVAGMRAFAIIFVVWFHLSQNNTHLQSWAQLPQGFYGVDIFIAIMGYFFIKGMLKKEDTSLITFISGKISRLFVPLAIIVFLTCILSLFCLDSTGLCNMGKTGVATMLGGANLQLKYSESDYFSLGSAMNPFFHTWYISVAIQLLVSGFICFAILRKCSAKARVTVLVTIAVISWLCDLADPIRSVLLHFNLPCPWEWGVFSYYDVIPRIWVFLAGGLAIFLPEIRNRYLLSSICFIALMFVLFPVLSKSSSSSCVMAVAAGTILLIRYAGSSWLSPVLNNKVVLWIGRISFSLYLVHVPIIVAFKGYFYTPIYFTQALCLFLFSVLAGAIFYYLIESKHLLTALKNIAYIVAVALCTILWQTDGLRTAWNKEANKLDFIKYPLPELCRYPGISNRLDTKVVKLHKLWYEGAWYEKNENICDKTAPEYPLFQLGNPERKPTFALIGDSHAEHFVAGFDTVANELDISGVFLASIIEPFWNRELKGSDVGYDFNRSKAESLLCWLSNHPEIEHVVVGQYWKKINWRWTDWNLQKVPKRVENNAAAIIEFCQRLRGAGKKVIFIAPLPEIQSNDVLGVARWMKRRGKSDQNLPDDFICTIHQYDESFHEVNSLLSKMETDGKCAVLRPHELMFCDGKVYAVRNGDFLYADKHHISVPESIRLSKLMKEKIQTLLKP